MIEEHLYRKILSNLPIACVDLVIRVAADGYLLVKRGSEPLLGEWYVPGGRIHRGERASEAAVRKLREEIGVEVDERLLTFLGYYEDYFDSDAFGPNPGYHTLSLVFEVTLPSLPEVRLDTSATTWKVSAALPARFKVVPSGAALP